MKKAVVCLLCSMAAGAVSTVYAQMAKPVVFEKANTPEMLWALVLPETAETFASRYDKEQTRIGQAQAVLERELLDAGFKMVTITPPVNAAAVQDQLLQEALAAGADYLIAGEASITRILSSESGRVGGGSAEETADGTSTAEWGSINRPEYSASIHVRILRVADGRLMQTESANSTPSVRTRQGGTAGAVEDASRQLLRALIPEMEDILRRHDNQNRTVFTPPDLKENTDTAGALQ